MAQDLMPVIPPSRGQISHLIIDIVRSNPEGGVPFGRELPPYIRSMDSPLTDDDLQLALYICYELHYRAFRGVNPDWEWNPDLIRITGSLEAHFLRRLIAELPEVSEINQIIDDQLQQSSSESGSSSYLEKWATVEQFREFLIHRSAYHLKEADPHTWAIPRLYGPPKAALCALQLDEYGGGHAASIHSQLFAKTMNELDLNSTYGAYLSRIPGSTLATVNILSLFALHRKWRGALMGSLAVAEIKSSPSSARIANGLRRLSFGTAAQHFFTEHVEADAVHEQLMRNGVIGNLLKLEPELAASIAFGAQAFLRLGELSTNSMLGNWHDGKSSLLKS